MKFNFKRIAPVFASAVLLGSTIGFAAGAADLTAYPSTFASKGVADVAIVYGENANAVDVIAGDDFVSDLASIYGTSGTSSSTSATGETVKIESSSEKLNVGENLTNVRTTVITKSDLPSLLEKKAYQSKDGVTYDYEQEITLAPSLLYTQFADIDYNNKIPTLGITKSSNNPILNYTLRFIKTVESDVDSTGKLEDIQDSDITLLGKSYRILNAFNATNIKLELMAGAVVDTLLESGNKSYTISGKNFDVSVSNIATDGAALVINGQTTPKMAAGSTYKLSDGTQVGVRTLWYQSNKVSSVEFSLGAEKLTLENAQKLKMNDENVNDVIVYIPRGSSSSKTTLSTITLAWIPNDKLFVTSSKEAVMPGLKSIKLTMGDVTTPAKEIVNIEASGEKTIQIRAPIKSGSATIPVLTSNSTKTGYNKIGDENYNLRTADGSEIIFNRTIDRQFVASWVSTTAAESYLLRPTISRDVPSSGVNSTDIIDAVTGSTICDDKKTGDTCSVGGNIVLNINAIDVSGDGKVNITGGSGVSFNKLYTTEGLLINLPVESATATSKVYVNINATSNPTSWVMVVEEEDKSGNIASGKDINVSLGIASAKAEVNNVVMDGSGIFTGSNSITAYDVGGSSSMSKYQAYVQSELATKFAYDTKPDQNTLEIEYHGGESYGNVYIAASGATVSSGSAGVAGKLGSVSMTDNEADTAKPTKNLIVVGGPAVNKVSASLLGVAYPTYGSQLTGDNAISADQALVKLVASSYDSTKIALVVFGWEAKDTRAAAKYLVANAASQTGKSSVKLTTATGTAVVA